MVIAITNTTVTVTDTMAHMSMMTMGMFGSAITMMASMTTVTVPHHHRP
jgi:hypothetical protein